MTELMNIFLLEDEDALRNAEIEYLERRGFRVIAAANMKEADVKLANEPQIDVAILDNHIAGESRSGAEYALTLREEMYKTNPPECLVLSGEDAPKFYQQALRLGAADYYRKDDYQTKDLPAPIRALALRKAIRWERQPGTLYRLRKIADEAPYRDAALWTYAQEVLFGELTRVLANPFCLLISDLSGNYAIGGNGKHIQSPTVEELLGLAQSKKESDFLVDDFPKYPGEQKGHVIELYRRDRFRMVLAIMDIERSKEWRSPEDSQKMCDVLLHYVKPALFLSLESLIENMRGAQDAYLSGFSKGCASQLAQLREIQQSIKSGHTQVLTALEQSIANLSWHVDEGGAILSARKTQELTRTVRSNQPGVLGLAQKVWSELDGESENIQTDGEDLPAPHSKVLWRAYRRFFDLVFQRANQEGISPQVHVSLKSTDGSFKLCLKGIGITLSTLYQKILLNAGHESRLFLLQENIRNLNGYFALETQDDGSDPCLLITLPKIVAVPSASQL